MKKLLSIILSLTMILTSFVPTFAAEKETVNLCVLGASETNGFGMDGFMSQALGRNNIVGYKIAPEGIYARRMQDYLAEKTGKQVNLDQLAVSGMRPEELRVLLDDNYEGDSYTKWRYYDKSGEGKNWLVNLEGDSIDDTRAAFRNSIKNADVVTVSLGANTFGTYIITRLTSGDDFKDDLSLIDNEKVQIDAKEIQDTIKGIVWGFEVLAKSLGIKIDSAISSTIDEAISALVYAYAGYCANMEVVLDKIREINPEAQVEVVSIPNMVGELKINIGSISLPTTDAWTAVAGSANKYVQSLTDARGMQFANISNIKPTMVIKDELLDYNGTPSNNFKAITLYYEGQSTNYNKSDLYKAVEKKFDEEASVELDTSVSPIENPQFDAAFDALARCMKCAVEATPVQATDLLNADVVKVFNEGYAPMYDLAARAAVAAEKGEDFDVAAEIDKLLGGDENKGRLAVASLYTRAGYGSAAFSHPNADDHGVYFNVMKSVMESGEKCPHKFTKVENARKSTIYKEGYTGDTVCLICGHIENGKYIPKIMSTVKTAKLPCKVKQSFNAGSNLNIAKGDSVASVRSSNSKIAKVSGTKVTGKKKGSATIKLVMASGQSYSYEVKVQRTAVKCSSLKTTVKSTITLKKGQAVAIGATKAPCTCRYKITYKSSKKSVATVSSKGVIKAKKKGTAKITVKCKGKTKKITVKVL